MNPRQDHSPVRAEPVGRCTVLILIALMAVHGVAAARGLYADGSAFLLYVLHNDGFCSFSCRGDWHRWFANVVTQAPVVLAMHCGVTDTAMLIRIQSFGLIVIPLGMWVGALVAQWHRPLFWALVVMFAVTQLNSGFFVIGEYNFAYALVVLSAALLLRPQALTRWQLVVLVIAAVLAVLSYEALAYLGPVLLAIAAARVVGVRGVGAAGSTPERVTLIGLCVIYAVATVIAALSIMHPFDPVFARNAADLWTPLTLDRQFIISTVIAVLAVAVPLFPDRLRTPVTAAIAASAAVILLPKLWAAPPLHYAARTLTGLALGGLLAGAVVVQVVVARRGRTAAPRDSDATPAATTALVWVACLALLSAQLVPFTVHTAGFARWTAELEHFVVTGSHPVAVADSGLDPRLTQDYSVSWSNSFISRVLSEQPCQGSLLDTGQRLSGPLVEPQPRFVKRSRLFPGADTQVAGAQTIGAATNLISDGDFEDTTAQHDFYLNGMRITEQAHSGTHSWKLAQQHWYPQLSLLGKASDRSDYSKALRVRAGDEYYMEAWVYPQASNTGGGNLSLGTAVRDSTGQLNETWPSAFYGNPAKGQWTKICGTIKIPVGYDLSWFYVSLAPDVPMGDVFYFDDITVARVGSQQTLASCDTNLGPASSDTNLGRPAPADANLMLDSGFENTTATHDCFINGTRTADQAHTGTYSWKMTQQQWYPSLGFVGKISNRDDPSQALRVRPGDKYYLEAWIYPKSTNVGTGSLSMALTLRDTTGKQPEAYPHNYSGMPKRGQWTKIGTTVTIPDGYDLGWAGITVMTDVPMGDVFYIDDIMVVREQAH